MRRSKRSAGDVAVGLLVVAGIVALALAIGAGMGWLLALGWNAAIAGPFGAPRLLWWQAWIITMILSVVARILRGTPAVTAKTSRGGW